MPNYKVTVEEIDALLPQTQCGECGYAGCLPYANAMVNQNESINRCPPGGITTLNKLAEQLEQDPAPYVEEMRQRQKKTSVAIIREADCIGCTKCIQACPVDCIIGAAKSMHTILQQECTGCGLCIPACPVDCIDEQMITHSHYHPVKAKARFQAKQARQIGSSAQKQLDRMRASMINTQKNTNLKSAKKDFIQAALARVKAKRAE